MKRHASMNRIYRLVWNHTTETWVAVAENAKGMGKSVSGRKLIAAALALTGGAFIAPLAYAGPTGGQISVGAGTISQAGVITNINQSSAKLAINWQGFNVAAGETVNFIQPSATAVALNRVLGQNPSQILGNMNANGQVFVLNPNGVLFGAGAQVNVGGLVASTLGQSDANFMAGNNVFSNGGKAGSVTNLGKLTAANGGYLALLAPQVSNQGVMTATLGTAMLAAGDKVTLNLNNGGLVGYSIDQGALNALAENKQLIQAQGGQVVLSAKAADALTASVVNNSGIIEAQGISTAGGKILLVGDSITSSGTLDASGATGGSISLQSGLTGTTIVTGVVNAAGSTGVGGTVEVLGDKVGLFAGANVNVSGDTGGGIALIGGNFHGAGSQQNASQTIVDQGAFIRADAITSGNGGKVAIWSNKYTQFLGDVSATGGANSGNGGFVETSGKQALAFSGRVDTRATRGTAGTLLLDPTDMMVIAAPSTQTATLLPAVLPTLGTTTFTDTAAISFILNTTIQKQLGIGNVIIDTTSGAAGTGNITTLAPIAWNSVNSLTLNAVGTGSIVTSSTIANAGTGGLTLQTAGGAINLGADVTLGGGTFVGTVTGAGNINLNAALNAGVGAVNLTTLGAITQGVLGVTAGTLTTSSGTGVTLTGANAVSNFTPTNAVGAVSLTNTAASLALSPITSTGLTIKNTGAISVNGALNGGTGLTSIIATGALALGANAVTGTGVTLGGAVTNLAASTINAGAGDILVNGNAGAIGLAGALLTTSVAPTAVTVRNASSVALGNITTGATGTVTLGVLGDITGAVTQTGIINTGTLAGATGALSRVILAGANTLTNLGAFSTGAGLTVNDSTLGLNVTGIVSGGTGLTSITTAGGALALGANAVGGTGVTLNGVGVTNLAASTVNGGAGDITVNGGAAAINLAGALTTTSITPTAITVRNASTVALGNVSSTGTTTLGVLGDITGAVTQTGIITAGTLAGSTGALSNVTLAGANVLTNLGAFTSGAGLTVNDATLGLGVTGAVNSGTGSASITTAGGALALGVNAVSGAGVILNGAGVTSLATSIVNAGAGDIMVNGGAGAINLAGALTTTSNLATAVTVHNATTAVIGSITTGATGTTTLGVLNDITGAVTQTQTGVINTGTLTGGTSPLGSVTLGGANVLTNLGAFTTGAGLTVNDSTLGLTVTGVVNGGTGLTSITTAGGALAVGANAVSGTGVTLGGAGVNNLAASIVNGGAGDITVNGGAGAVSLAGALTTTSNTATAATIRNATTVALANVTTGATGTTTLGVLADITGAVTQTGIINTGTLAGSTAGSVMLAGANTLTNLGAFTSGAGLTVNDSTLGLNVTGAVNGGTGLTSITTVGAALALGAAVSGTGVTLNSVGVTSLAASTINGGTGDILINGGAGAINLAGALTTSSNTVTAVNVHNGSTVALGNITTGITGTTTLGVGVGALADITGAVTQTGVITTGTLTGSTANSVVLGGANVLTNLGAFTSGAGLTINDSTLGLTVTGAVNSGIGPTSISTAATTPTVVGGALALGANTITGAGVTLSGGGVNSLAASIVNAGAGDIMVNGGAGAISLAGALITTSNTATAVTVRNANTAALGNITTAATGTTTLGVAGDITGAVTQTGIINTGTLTGSAGLLGSVTLGGANVLTNLGAFSTGAGLTVNDSTLGLNVTGAISGGTGLTSITTAGGALAVGANAISGTGVTLGGVGVSNLALSAVNGGAGDITVNGGAGAVSLAGALTTTSNTATAATIRNATTVALSNVTTGATGTTTLGVAGDITGAVTQTGIITTGILTGNTGALSSVTLAGANALTNLGAFTSAGLTVNNVGSIALNGLITSLGAGNVVVEAGAGTLAGITTGGNITVGALGSIVLGTGTAKLYTGSVAGSTGLATLVGGVGSGAFRYNSTQAIAKYTATTVAAGGKYAIYRESPILTITASPVTRVYGSVVPALTPAVTGLANGDTTLQAFSTQATTTAAGTLSTSGNLTVGTHALTAAGAVDQLGYTIAPYVAGSLTVTPLALTGTIAPVISTYGSAVTPGVVTLTNKVGTDVLTTTTAVNTTGLLSTSGKLKAGAYIGAQSLSALGGADAANYTFAGVVGDYTVNPLALTGTAIAAVNTTYGTPAATGAVTFGNAVALDVVGATSAIVAPLNSTSLNLKAASYAQTATVLTGADAANYTFAPFTTVTNNYVVSPLALTGSIAPATSTYGSVLTPGVATLTGIKLLDLVTPGAVVVTTTGLTSTSGNLKAGTYVGAQKVSVLAGADAANYSFAGVVGDYTVNKLALTGAITAGTSVYGSALTPGVASLTGAVALDLVTPGALTVTTTGLTSTSGNLKAGTYIGAQKVSVLTGADAVNYSFAGVVGDYTVSKLALTGTAIAAGTSIYGAPVATGAVTFANAIALDVVTPTVAFVAPLYSTSGNLKVGSYAQTATGALAGADGANYTLAPFTTATNNYTVAQLALTGSIATATSTYGSALTSGAVNLTGLKAGDLVSTGAVAVNTAGLTSASGKLRAGTYVGIQSVGAPLTGADAANYTFTGAVGNYTVNQLALTGAIAAATSTYGAALTPGLASLTGVVGGDLVTTGVVSVNTTGLTSTSGNFKAGVHLGAQSVSSLGGADAANYSFAGVVGDYTVNPLALTGTAIAAVTATYGTPKATGAVTFGNALALDAVATTSVIVTPVNSTSGNLKAGSYAQSSSVLTGVDGANYTLAPFTTATNNYTVNQLALTGSVAAATSTYGALLTPGAVNLAGIKAPDVVNTGVVVVNAAGLTDANGSLKVGTHLGIQSVGAALTGADAANYTFAGAVGDYTVSPAALTAAAAAATTTSAATAATSAATAATATTTAAATAVVAPAALAGATPQGVSIGQVVANLGSVPLATTYQAITQPIIFANTTVEPTALTDKSNSNLVKVPDYLIGLNSDLGRNVNLNILSGGVKMPEGVFSL